MSRDVSLEELASLLGGEQLTRPRIAGPARACLGKAAEAIERIGLPLEFAGVYKAVDEVSLVPVPKGCRYRFQQRWVPVRRAAEIGRGEFGSCVVVCDTAHLVFINSEGPTHLINTSVERFLFFVGRFWQSNRRRFTDGDALFADCQEVDEAAFADPNEGFWSLTIEEARAGMY